MASVRRQRCLVPPPPFRGVSDEGWACERTLRVGQWFVGLRIDSPEVARLLDEAAGEHLRPGVGAPPHYGLVTAGPLPATQRPGGSDGPPLEPGVLVRGPVGVLEQATTAELLTALDAYLGTHVTLPRRPLLALRGVVALVDGRAVLTEPATDDLWVLARLRRSLAASGVQLAHTFGALVDPESAEVVVPGGVIACPSARTPARASVGASELPPADPVGGSALAPGPAAADRVVEALGVPAGRYPLAGWVLSRRGEGRELRLSAPGGAGGAGNGAGRIGPPASRGVAVALGAAAVVEAQWAGGAQAALGAVVELLAAVPAVVASGDPDAQLSWLAGAGRAWLGSASAARG